MAISEADLDNRLRRVSLEMGVLERFLSLFAELLDPPTLRRSSQSAGFRFLNPDGRHFCLLKSARAVSAMNAAVLLARGGFSQEIVVLLRTMVECVTHIEYVLFSYDADGTLGEPARSYVHKYFADTARDSVADYRGAKVTQKSVHKLIGSKLDDVADARELFESAGRTDTAELMSNVYLNFSNYVHARYPEVMDMYGGVPGHFHLRGMRHTRKDDENIEVLETYATTVSQTIALVAWRFGMRLMIQSDPDLGSWWARHSGD